MLLQQVLCCVITQVDELNEEKVLFGPGREEQRDEKKLMVIFRCAPNKSFTS
jgi:hypothetical protein